jgi:predicted acylesterase/phospholipase RssA
VSRFESKVGLALSGGGLRAPFCHLGVLARLAELNVLRHVDVLSRVSGGSIVGGYYWLALRERMSKDSLDNQGTVSLLGLDCTVVSGLIRGQAKPLPEAAYM